MERDSMQIELKLKAVSEIKKHIQMRKEMLDDLKVVLIESHE